LPDDEVLVAVVTKVEMCFLPVFWS
jgi:hypothetical protein